MTPARALCVGFLLVCGMSASRSADAGDFVYPVGRPDIRPRPDVASLSDNGYVVTRRFKESVDGVRHTGVDLANGQEGGEIRSITDGTVVRVQEQPLAGFGNLVRIEHSVPGIGTIYSQYAHLQNGSIRVVLGDSVRAGTIIGAVDCTGATTGTTMCASNGRTAPHLHFAIQLMNRNGCGYLPDSRCSNDTFALYHDPLQFIADQRTPRFTPIDFPGAFETEAYGINNAGQIVGGYNLTFFPARTGFGFLLEEGAFTTINLGQQTVAHGINSLGHIVGSYVGFLGGVFGAHGFLDVGGTFSTIDPPFFLSSGELFGINDAEQIVGSDFFNFVALIFGRFGFLKSAGVFTMINFPGAERTSAFGINSLGQIVGTYSEGFGIHGFLLSGGGFTAIDFPGALETMAFGINRLGQIVGRYIETSGRTHGFLFSGGVFTTIDFPGAAGTEAFGINDAGQIVGRYVDGSGNIHGFLTITLSSSAPQSQRPWERYVGVLNEQFDR